MTCPELGFLQSELQAQVFSIDFLNVLCAVPNDHNNPLCAE
jgi:hypothetical protein